MFHVVLIYTCNMKENALASCIHMHGHIASSRVCVHGTIIHHSWLMCGELRNGTTSKIETHGWVQQ